MKGRGKEERAREKEGMREGGRKSGSGRDFLHEICLSLHNQQLQNSGETPRNDRSFLLVMRLNTVLFSFCSFPSFPLVLVPLFFRIHTMHHNLKTERTNEGTFGGWKEEGGGIRNGGGWLARPPCPGTCRPAGSFRSFICVCCASRPPPACRRQNISLAG